MIDALTEIISQKNSHTIGKAITLVTTFCDIDFIIITFSFAHLLSYTYPLSKIFLKKRYRFKYKNKYHKNTMQTLLKCRENVNTEF